MIRFIFSLPQWFRVLVSILYLSVVAGLSLMPSDDVPQIEMFPGFDKVVHGCMYLGLTVLACWTLHAEIKRIKIVYVVLFSISWGLLMEISQLEMMLGRAFEWKDELANSVGSLLGAVIYLLIVRLYQSQRRVVD
ncbi:MAG: VanZ family protein [Prolixibacteraceae bacterium]